MDSVDCDLDTTYCSVFESQRRHGLRNQKTVKYPMSTPNKSKKMKNKKKLCVVKDCSDVADNLIKKQQVYVSDVSFSVGDNNSDVNSKMLKLKITDVKKITSKKPKKTPIRDNVLDDTGAIRRFNDEFLKFLEEVKLKRTHYKEREVIFSQSDSEDCVQILSPEMTEEDRLDSLIIISQSRTYLESMMDCCKIDQ